MDLDQMLTYYYGISSIPIAYYDGSTLVKDFSTKRFLPDPAYYYLQKPISDKPMMDLVISADIMMFGYVHIKDSDRYILLGPVRESSCNRKIAQHICEELEQPPTRLDELLSFFDRTPRLSHSRMLKNIVFLNYLVNQEQPPQNFFDKKLASIMDSLTPEEQAMDFVTHDSVNLENRLLACVEFGEIDELLQMLKNPNALYADMGITANDPLRSYKNIFVSSVAVVSRAAIRGGMDYERAMVVSDTYLQKMETLNNYNEIFALLCNMFTEYTECTQKIRKLNVSSKIVHMVCNYVEEHLYEKITVADIAGNLTFNRTYLSNRFKQDTGKTLTQYINEQKIEKAQYLLKATKKSIMEITELLNYSSQSYFQTVFKTMTGLTPVAYRHSDGISSKISVDFP
jgi:AraC-like DNA-binding protein